MCCVNADLDTNPSVEAVLTSPKVSPFLGFLLEALVTCLTHRGASMLGGFLMALGFFISGFADHIAYVYIAYSFAGKNHIGICLLLNRSMHHLHEKYL